jgi:mutator protein MutT
MFIFINSLKLGKIMSKRYSGVIIRSNNKVLLCKRKNYMKYPGEWSVPGGSIESGETPIDAAARELKEETSIDVTSPLTLCGMIKRYTRDGLNLKGLMYVFEMSVDEEVQPDLENSISGGEHSECGYFSRNELPQPISYQLINLIQKLI